MTKLDSKNFIRKRTFKKENSNHSYPYGEISNSSQKTKIFYFKFRKNIGNISRDSSLEGRFRSMYFKGTRLGSIKFYKIPHNIYQRNNKSNIIKIKFRMKK